MRYVQAAAARVGIAPGDRDEVAPGAAGDLEHAAARRRIELGNEPVAAEQVELAGGVIDEALAGVDPIHQPADLGRRIAHAARR